MASPQLEARRRRKGMSKGRSLDLICMTNDGRTSDVQLKSLVSLRWNRLAKTWRASKQASPLTSVNSIEFTMEKCAAE